MSGRTVGSLRSLTTADTSRTFWVGLPVVAAFLVYAGYLLTHAYPGYGGGLFVAYSEAILAHDYALPSFVRGYGPTPIPFAYPPLGFYVLAAGLDATGLGPLELTRVLPGLVIPAYAAASFFLFREWTDSDAAAGVGALFLAVTPTVFLMRLTAGGAIRAPAYLLLIVGLYVGTRLFRTHRPRYLLFGVVTFALTILYHPVETAFFAISYVVFWATLDRSREGFAAGVAVAAGGFVLTSPWWLTVVGRHGYDVFVQASRTHRGLGVDVLGPFRLLYSPASIFPSLWPAFLVVGSVAAVVERRWALLTWFVVAVFLLSGAVHMAMIPGSALAGLGVVRAASALGVVDLRPTRSRLSLPPVRGSHLLVGLVVAYAVATGVVYAANTPMVDSQTTQSYVDGSDVAAMEWVRHNTPPDVTFVVLGDASEWFPALAERPSLNTWRGQEWVDARRQQRLLEANDRLAECTDVGCVRHTTADAGLSPDYLYVPKGTYSSNYRMVHQPSSMRESIRRSDRYRVVYENEGAMVVRVTDA